MKIKQINADMIGFFCPGCMKYHHVDLSESTYNGNPVSPTISPAVRIIHLRSRKVLCQGTIENGHIEFSEGSEHFLAGQKEELPHVD